MSTKRKYCRICGGLAGMTRNICAGCQSAEFNRALHERGRARPGERNPAEMQRAWAEAIKQEPDVKSAKVANWNGKPRE